jgi:hypothetical protein
VFLKNKNSEVMEVKGLEYDDKFFKTYTQQCNCAIYSQLYGASC